MNAAIDALQPARIKIASGEAKGKIAYNYYAPDLYDQLPAHLRDLLPFHVDEVLDDADAHGDAVAGQLRPV